MNPAGPMNLKERREKLKREIEALGAVLCKCFKFEKNSQLRIIKLALLCLTKEARFAPFNRIPKNIPQLLDSYLTINYLDSVIITFT